MKAIKRIPKNAIPYMKYCTVDEMIYTTKKRIYHVKYNDQTGKDNITSYTWKEWEKL